MLLTLMFTALWLHYSQERMSIDILQRKVDKVTIRVNTHRMGVRGIEISPS